MGRPPDRIGPKRSYPVQKPTKEETRLAKEFSELRIPKEWIPHSTEFVVEVVNEEKVIKPNLKPILAHTDLYIGSLPTGPPLDILAGIFGSRNTLKLGEEVRHESSPTHVAHDILVPYHMG